MKNSYWTKLECMIILDQFTDWQSGTSIRGGTEANLPIDCRHPYAIQAQTKNGVSNSALLFNVWMCRTSSFIVFSTFYN